jgi:hypothetical protein
MSTNVSEVYAAFIIRAMSEMMMEAACTSETLVNIQLRTQQYIPEDFELHYYFNFLVHFFKFSNW